MATHLTMSHTETDKTDNTTCVVDVTTAPGEARASEPGPSRPSGSSRWKAILAALRPHQWIKNVLIFTPLLLAHQWSDLHKVLTAGAAFLSLSLVASAAYIVNDLCDIEADRRHPTKRLRPFASGNLPLAYGAPTTAILLITAFTISSLLLSWEFTVAMITYLSTALAYSFWLKRVLILDVVVLAGLYTLRIVAGGRVVDVEVSHWLLVFSMFLFISLAFAKRYTELKCHVDGNVQTMGTRGYIARDLRTIETVGANSGYLSVLVFALYISSRQASFLYNNPTLLWLICPLFLYWITRIWFLAGRGELSDDPVVFAARDPNSILVGLWCLALLLLSTL